MKKNKISIVAGCYNEVLIIEKFAEIILQTLDKYLDKYEYEIIISDNNSNDGTIEKICENNKKIKALLNFKNYGAEKSSFNGLKFATGNVIITANIDLEEGTELIHNFIREWESGKKFSIGKKNKENSSFVLRALKKLFYFLFNSFSSIKLIPNSTSIMIDREMLSKLIKNGENDPDPFVRSLAIDILGQPESIVNANYVARNEGYSKHKLFDLYNIASSGFFKSTSSKMPKVITLLGILIFLVVIIFTLTSNILISLKILKISYFAIIITSIVLILLSLIVIFCGFIMEYLISILTILKNEKVLLKDKINFDEN